MVLTPSQKIIAKDRHRFRVLRCGRRFGKTTLATEEMIGKAVSKNDQRIAYIAPTYQQARDICWEALKKRCYSISRNINESRLEISLKTQFNGTSQIFLRGWESVETLRGQRFDFLITDEIREMRGWRTRWNEVLRPTLTDTKGHALFISTPNGYDHFYELSNLELKDKDFKSFHFTTYDNPHIPVEEIEKAKQELTEEAFGQEFLAEFKKYTGLIYKEFDRDIHVIEPFPISDYWIVEGCMDFGAVNPTVHLWLAYDNSDNVYVFNEYYKSGQVSKFHADLIKAMEKRVPTIRWRDPSAEQEGLDYTSFGVFTAPAVKNFTENHSWVNAGIEKVKSFLKIDSQTKRPKLFIFNNCVNLIREFESYRWQEKKDEMNSREVPEKINDHGMDALRYGLGSHFQRKDNEDVIDIPANSFTGY